MSDRAEIANNAEIYLWIFSSYDRMAVGPDIQTKQK
jgi:hypothetical protein